MEEEYNWSLILKSAVPVALAVAYIFYTNLGDAWKWAALVIGVSLSAMIVYINDKKKNNVFTAAAIVLLAALIMKLIRNLGVF